MSTQIAETILMQLGGSRRIKAMTGAKHFVADGARLNIGLPGQKCVRITLDATDTYTVETLKFNTARAVVTQGKPLYRVAKSESGIYADQLRETFTRQTGLELSL